MDAMETNAIPDLPPASISPDGTSRFYGWAPDPTTAKSRRRWKHRISVHERNRTTGHRRDDFLDIWFDTFDEAEAFVMRLNTAIPMPEKYRAINEQIHRERVR